jgi:hypothetical protein
MKVYTTHIHVTESEEYPAMGVVLVFNAYPTKYSVAAAMEKDPIVGLPKHSMFRTVVKQALEAYGVPLLFTTPSITASSVSSTWTFSAYSATDAIVGATLGHISIHAKEVWVNDE